MVPAELPRRPFRPPRNDKVGGDGSCSALDASSQWEGLKSRLDFEVDEVLFLQAGFGQVFREIPYPSGAEARGCQFL